MDTNKKLPLEYIIREPQIKIKRSPVIFMLHGYGSNEEDLFSFDNALPPEYTIISFIAPYHLASFGYAWYMINFDADQNNWSDTKQAIESRDLIMQAIEEACRVYDLDTRNVTLLGFSQGSILSMAVALSYPKKIRNVIALSGYLNKDIIKEGYEREHSMTHFYISHGSSDQVIPVEWARQTPVILDSIDVKYRYEEFPVGHGVSPQNFYSFREWLTQQ